MACLKTHVMIKASLSPVQHFDDSYQSYSTLTRDDGFVIRINESYFVPKQNEANIDLNLTSPQYDILYVERLWIDDYGAGQAAGYYYIRPNETFHEPHRKFYCNEVFRFPSSNDPLPISCFVRPCFVLDMGTYCKGKPISDNSSRILSSDLFVCEFRVDKSARNFSRLIRSRNLIVNTKPHCFDIYVEKLVIKRDYQAHRQQLRQQQQLHPRRRTMSRSTRTTSKNKEKFTRINGIIEKIYCRFRDPKLLPIDLVQPNERLLPASLPRVLERKQIECQTMNPSTGTRPPERTTAKRRFVSMSSEEENETLPITRVCPRSSKRRRKMISYASRPFCDE
jgi:hypothetical protein